MAFLFGRIFSWNCSRSLLGFTLLSVVVLLPAAVAAQKLEPRAQTIASAQKEFEKALFELGTKRAFLDYLSDDSVIFQPDAVNGKQYWTSMKTEPEGKLRRTMLYYDASSNGLLGYTTGRWEWTPKGKTAPVETGQFVTVWAKRQGGRFQAVLDMTTTQDKEVMEQDNDKAPDDRPGDPNKRGWSAADPSMNFLKTAMGGSRLGGAYSTFAADEVRLIREGDLPIVGKKKVISETQDYRSISYPKRVVLNEAADMAYVWNPCEYANSDEGVERGNCLHIWKLRGKKWYVTLGVLSRVRNTKKPELRLRPKLSGKN